MDEKERQEALKEIPIRSEIYNKAKEFGRTDLDRWGKGIDHHLKSLELMEFLCEHDFRDYGDYFWWKKGGDGDNGETLMYEMDAYFETLDLLEKNK